MKIFKDIYKAIIDTYVLWITGIALIIWGAYADGWIRIGFGSLLIYWGIKSAIDDYRIDKKIQEWLIENNGKMIFFYPTKKNIQKRIKAEILPLFENDVMQVYYDGPKIVGDLESINFLLKRIMLNNKSIRPNNPSIIEIKDGEFVVKDELDFLMKLTDNTSINRNEVRKRIKNACG